MRGTRQLIAWAAALGLACAAGLSADPFADAVVGFSPAGGVTFGQTEMPGNVLGRPEGGASAHEPQFNPQELVSLGPGGSITLEFVDNLACNGPGPDLIVFENVLERLGDDDPFTEVAVVEVSLDGVQWHMFPFDYVPYDPPDPPTALPVITDANFPTGFAGVHATLTNSTNGVDPTDPAAAGGDAFEFDDVGVDCVRFVRITDAVGMTDGDGDVVEDDGDFPPINTGASIGFDLDAVAAVHSEGTTPVRGWRLYR